jgi:hypothetical protein
MTPLLARSLTWVEADRGGSIVFDLKIAVVADEPEVVTQRRFIAEAIRIIGAFVLEQDCKSRPSAGR